MTLLLTIREAAQALRCSRASVFRLIATGVLVKPARRFGRESCVTAESVRLAIEQGGATMPVKAKRHRVRRRAFAAELDATLAALRRPGAR